MPDTGLVQAFEHNEKTVKATMPINEADTCRTYVVPKLNNAGWKDTQISEQKNLDRWPDHARGKRAFRRLQKRATPA